MTELIIGKLVRINTEKCPSQSPCEHPFGHIQYHGETGLIEDDARKYTGPSHGVECETCGKRVTVAEYVQLTGHFWIVCVGGHHPIFHTDELTEMAPIGDQVREALRHTEEVLDAVSELVLEGVGADAT